MPRTDDTLDENLLHAYVDDALPEEERLRVAQHLATDADAAARVRAYRAQNEALREAFAPVLTEPHGMQVGAVRAAASSRWPASALAATLALGVAVGYLARGQLNAQAPATPVFVQQAALAHVAYKPEVRHPVEVPATQEQHLVAWLSKRLSAPLKAPLLTGAGYHLLGGRLLPAPSEDAPAVGAPVALLMYENAQGRRLSLLVRREVDNRDTAFRFSQRGETGVFYWIDGPLGYALAGDVPRDELSQVAQLVYRQLNP